MNPSPRTKRIIAREDGSSLRIIVFVAGGRPRIEAAVDLARKLHPDSNLIFVCEPMHCGWISQRPGESTFVVRQPFNPFGREASELLRSLVSGRIDGCALIVADAGFESFRFRIFALRLRVDRFVLLQGGTPDDSKELDRFSFALAAGMTFFLRCARKLRLKRHSNLFSGGDGAALCHGRKSQTEVGPSPGQLRAPKSPTRSSELIRLSDGWDDALSVILFINRQHIMVKPGARILDVGCGAGRMVFRLRELGFDAYGFDIHDYVECRSDDDRQWFRFSLSTSRDKSAFTIDATRYAMPFEDDFFDVVYSTSVIEHVLDIRPMMRECARVLRPTGITVHFYPSKYQVVETHLYVPLASFIQYKNWLRLWIALGARNEFQGQKTVREVTEAYKEYTITGLHYRTRKELRDAAGEFFSSVSFVSRAYVPGDNVWAQIRQMVTALRTHDVYRQLALCNRLSAIVCDQKRLTQCEK